MPLRADLLQPIPGSSPAGADLRYDPIYDKIKDARLEDDDAPQGEWERPSEGGGFRPLVGEAGGRRARLPVEGPPARRMAHRGAAAPRGLRRAARGTGLLRGLLQDFWEVLYPPLEDGDAELRAAPLAWVALTLTPLVRSVPLTASGLRLLSLQRVARRRERGGCRR